MGLLFISTMNPSLRLSWNKYWILSAIALLVILLGKKMAHLMRSEQ